MESLPELFSAFTFFVILFLFSLTKAKKNRTFNKDEDNKV